MAIVHPDRKPIIQRARQHQYQRHIKAAFEDMLVRDAQAIGPVMTWSDRQRKAGELSEASIRHNMNLLSRFFS